MGSKVPRKKVDFFNGGRGVDLSQFNTDSRNTTESMEAEGEGQLERSPENAGLANGELFNSFSPVSPFAMSEPNTSPPPLTPTSPPPLTPTSPIPPQSPPFMHAPIPQYSHPPYNHFEYSDASSPLTGGHYIPEIQNQGLGFHPFSHPSIHHPHNPHYPHPPLPTITTASHFPPPPSIFPSEPSYSGFIGSAYSPLRPMEANGFGGMAYYDPIQGIDHTGTLSIARDEEMLKKKKRQQKCSLCSNHGVSVDVKGHKWFCPFRDCECGRCEITRGRQHHMKEQQKLTRQLQRLQ